MRTEVYSWRLSGELKSDLEREARQRNVPLSRILEIAVRDWLRKSAAESPDSATQRKLHAAAKRYFGVLASGDPSRAERAREIIRERLRRRYGR